MRDEQIKKKSEQMRKAIDESNFKNSDTIVVK